ncbi:ATP-binding cassette domain-containing protein [Leucobacter sp. GX24907]
MTQPGTIEIAGLTKRFGDLAAVSDLSFTAAPGRVTGFLGPNGSGKTTALSMLLGLLRPDAGTATVGGVPYARLEHPARTLGSSISASAHPAHTGRAHLDIMRRAIGVPASAVDEKLELVGLSEAADRRTGGYSLGMQQRLALATAMLGDPDVLVLDEPINGLDPEGIRWIRQFLRHLASEGHTILLSSHLLSEVQQTVDDLVIIRRGALVYEGTLESLGGEERAVLVSTPDNRALAAALAPTGAAVHGARGEVMRVTGATPDEVGRAALAAGLPLSHLSEQREDLEARFLALIDDRGSAEHGAEESAPNQPGPAIGDER